MSDICMRVMHGCQGVLVQSVYAAPSCVQGTAGTGRRWPGPVPCMEAALGLPCMPAFDKVMRACSEPAPAAGGCVLSTGCACISASSCGYGSGTSVAVVFLFLHWSLAPTWRSVWVHSFETHGKERALTGRTAQMMEDSQRARTQWRQRCAQLQRSRLPSGW